jgi:type I restriction enzyme S subunit
LEQSEMKKRAITKGLAQELLGGKTRLPGFTEPWRKDCAIADLCEKRTGYWGSDVMAGSGARRARVIRAGDITADGRLTGAADRYFTASQWKYAACRVDDVVITASGNGLGKTFYVADQSGLAASNFVRILRPKAGVSGEYLAHVMRSAPAKAMLETHTATSAYPNLMPSFFTEPWLSIPGYDEQMAIAATLRSSDDETARTRALLAKIKDVKQGMLQELLTGRTRLPVEVAA